tara:strand:+ start:805 stop:1065 length:261 start_codon:yes stop_codon:yes gene_type:complete
MEVYYSTKFKKQYRKLPKKIREQFQDRLTLFLRDQSNPQLNMHKLSGKYDGLWSVNITGNIRAVFDTYYKNTTIFVAIGTHSELYS